MGVVLGNLRVKAGAHEVQRGQRINFRSETVLLVGEVPRFLASVNPSVCPSVKTVYRWIRHGRSGKRLEACLLGGRTATTVEALERFGALAETPERSPGQPEDGRQATSGEAPRTSAAALSILERYGL